MRPIASRSASCSRCCAGRRRSSDERRTAAVGWRGDRAPQATPPRGLGLVVVVVTFAVVLPRIASYRDVWDQVKNLDTAWLVALGVAVLFNVVTYAPPWMIALPGLRLRQALPFTQASSALTYVAPGGGLVGMAGSYGLLRTWGFGSSDVARAVTLTGIWNQLANLLLPVIAVLLLSIENQRDALLTTVAVVGGILFGVAVALLALVFWSDGLARGIGDVVQSTTNRLLRSIRRGTLEGWPERLVRFRRATVGLIRRRWAALTVAAVVGNLAVFVVLLVSLRAVGVGASQITWIEAFAGWSLARALQLIPLTPGGVGPVELGMTGILVGFGGPNAGVVAAVLLYRAFTVLPTLLLGLATMGAWRWLGPGRVEGGVDAAAGNPPGG
ncbi:MAG: YbhN family protein [Gaiella sp.]|nr:YbhN family protein [Gaiella sp.]